MCNKTVHCISLVDGIYWDGNLDTREREKRKPLTSRNFHIIEKAESQSNVNHTLPQDSMKYVYNE